MTDRPEEKDVREAQDEAAGAAPDADADEAGAADALQSELDAAKEQLLRARADFDNYRKRTAREQARLRKTAAADLVRDLLPVVDNLERAVAHSDGGDQLAEGVAMVLKQCRDVLTQHGVTPIAATGETFDPNVHEAMTRIPSAEHPPGVVAQEFVRGYALHGFVVRPAKVAVSAGPPADDEEAQTANNRNEQQSESS